MVFARAIDITLAGAPCSIKKLSNRNKRKEKQNRKPKRRTERELGSVTGLQKMIGMDV
jgi:hypothetical protein